MANPFIKKVWQKRLSEHPTRRTLVNVDTNESQTVDFTRAEGQIYQQGDGFTETNMNDLENRIYQAFDGVSGLDNISFNIPRAIPKDITSYYNDGTLFDRMAGKRGFSQMEDIRPGDFFKLSRRILANAHNATDYPQIYGSDWVTIIGINVFPIEFGNVTRFYPSITLIPGRCSIPKSQYYDLMSFGICKAHNVAIPSGTESPGVSKTQLRTQILGNATSNGSTASSATISEQLYSEFGEHLATIYDPEPGSISSDKEFQCSLLSVLDIIGYHPQVLVPVYSGSATPGDMYGLSQNMSLGRGTFAFFKHHVAKTLSVKDSTIPGATQTSMMWTKDLSRNTLPNVQYPSVPLYVNNDLMAVTYDLDNYRVSCYPFDTYDFSVTPYFTLYAS